jgi:multiple antibiotic resistance protein
VFSEIFAKFLTNFVTLFSIVDPLSAIPLFLTLTKRNSLTETKMVMLKSVGVACGILCAFALLGGAIFNFFGITPHAFQIAGGVLLFLVGLQQVNAHESRISDEEKLDFDNRQDVSIFPLAFPILAGPGALSVVVLNASRSHRFLDTVLLLFVIVLVMGSALIAFLLAPQLKKLLGQTGLSIIMRLGGIILIAIAVQFILDGIQSYLNVL